MARLDSREPMGDGEKFVRALRTQWRADADTLAPYKRAMVRHYDFSLKLNHYPSELIDPNDRTGRIQVRTCDLYDLDRFTAAEINNTAKYVEITPVGEAPKAQPMPMGGMAPMPPGMPGMPMMPPGMPMPPAPPPPDPRGRAAELLQMALSHDIQDVDTGTPDVWRRVVRMATAVGAGAAILELKPGSDPLGAYCQWRFVDPGDVTWSAGYHTPTQPGCPRLYVRLRPTIAMLPALKALGFAGTDQIRPDDGESEARASTQPLDDQDAVKRWTLLMTWDMDDPAMVESTGPVPIPPEKQWNACPSCGYSEQQSAQNLPGYDGRMIDEGAPCPMCSVPMAKPQSEVKTRRVRKFPGGRLTFTAPYNPTAGIMSDGPVPEGLSGFPLLWYVPDPFPNEPFGNCNAFLHNDTQCGIDAIYRLTLEQFARNRDFIVTKEDALWTADHEPYMIETGGPIAYAEDESALAQIRQFQGSGMNPATPAVVGMFQNTLRGNRGTEQFDFSAEKLKGTAVGTLARAQEVGSVPVNERVNVWREAQTYAFRRQLEAMLAYWTPQRWAAVLGDAGAMELLALKAAGHCDRLKLNVTAEPGMDAVDVERIRAFKEMAPLAQMNPAMFRIMARAAHVPQSWIEEVLKATAMQPPMMTGPTGMDGTPGMAYPAPQNGGGVLAAANYAGG